MARMSSHGKVNRSLFEKRPLDKLSVKPPSVNSPWPVLRAEGVTAKVDAEEARARRGLMILGAFGGRLRWLLLEGLYVYLYPAQITKELGD
jgi:hypothetical protein